MKAKKALLFKGIYFRSIDFHGRIVIPANFRKALIFTGSNKVMVSRFDKTLVTFTLAEWKEIKRSTLSLSKKSKAVSEFRKFFIDHAIKRSLDERGRILIPRDLRRYAEFEKAIVIVGLLNRFDILSLERWNQIKIEHTSDYATYRGYSGRLVENDIPDITA